MFEFDEIILPFTKPPGLFFLGGGQASTPQVPTPVEKVPGLQNLGTMLIQRLMQIMQGSLLQRPYTGYSSVFGGTGGTFPGAYSPNPATATAGATTGLNTTGGFQSIVDQAISSAVRDTGGEGGGGFGG